MDYKMFFFNRFHVFVLVRISSLSGVRNAEVVSSILIRSTNSPLRNQGASCFKSTDLFAPDRPSSKYRQMLGADFHRLGQTPGDPGCLREGWL